MLDGLGLPMRILLVQGAVICLALLPACTQVTPIASPESTPPPSAVPTAPPVPSTPTKQATSTPHPPETPRPTPTPMPEASPTPEPEPTPDLRPQRANEAIDVYLKPREDQVGYLVEGAVFSPTGAGQNGWVEIIDANGNRLWIEANSDYMPEEEYVPPAPTATPETVGPVCEAPYFGGRTPDRKTGYHFAFGNYRPEIYNPDTSPYAPYYNGAYWTRLHIPGYDWIYRRDARVISVDRQTGVIDFYVGSGVTVKRRFTEATRVVMSAHEWYRGMPMTDAFRHGGNFCDLEAEDMAALLHPTLGEAQYLDPNLIDLWGVLIVQ